MGQRCSVLQAVDAGGMRRSLQTYTLEQHAGFLATKKSLNDFLFLSRQGLLTTLAQNDEPKTA